MVPNMVWSVSNMREFWQHPEHVSICPPVGQALIIMWSKKHIMFEFNMKLFKSTQLLRAMFAAASNGNTPGYQRQDKWREQIEPYEIMTQLCRYIARAVNTNSKVEEGFPTCERCECELTNPYIMKVWAYCENHVDDMWRKTCESFEQLWKYIYYHTSAWFSVLVHIIVFTLVTSFKLFSHVEVCDGNPLSKHSGLHKTCCFLIIPSTIVSLGN